MGVPTFYRWLCTKYPKVVKDVIEERESLCEKTNTFMSADLDSPNPNTEFDNLYIDMNGVVHPCCHPEDIPVPEKESEMFQNVCDYIDRIVNIVRPRRLLYLALDGVAPRAKMNQQRSRRYKAAAENELSEVAYLELKKQFESEGREVPPMTERWDSNVITPGTPFMDRLAIVLRYYVARRVESSSYWQKLRILISDSNVPGEGEHKVMSFVRTQRTMPNYDPNTRHVMHGMDADLIMLGLATHEAHFYILREVVLERTTTTTTTTDNSNSKKPVMSDSAVCTDTHQKSVEKQISNIKFNESFRGSWKPLQFLRLPVLREYLGHEFFFSPEELLSQDKDTGQLIRISSDIERHIDDFVLMCFFVGNDFLPHLPSLSIHKGSIDQMLALYKAIFPALGDYLTNQGRINPEQLRHFTKYLADVEPKVLEEEFKRKLHLQRLRDRDRNSEQQQNSEQQNSETEPNKRFKPSSSSAAAVEPTTTPITHQEKIDLFRSELKKKLLEQSEINNDQNDDQIQLGNGDLWFYRRKYYCSKFQLSDNDNIEEIAKKVSGHYLKGLQWVLLYYYQGVPSWNWFFPFHYAPLAFDLFNYSFEFQPTQSLPEFDYGAPLAPLEQLLANLPPRSAKFLPDCYANLMLASDSPLIDFYPKKFHEDPDGKRFRWQWIARLPFIDSNRLISAAVERRNQLDELSSKRNQIGSDLVFLGTSHPDYNICLELAANTSSKEDSYGTIAGLAGDIQTHTFDGNFGDIDLDGFKSFKSSCLVCVFKHPEGKHHMSRLLNGAKPPAPLLTPEDFDESQNQQQTGNGNSRRGPFNSNAAKRMILHVVGGPHLEKYLAQQQLQQRRFESNRPQHHSYYNNPNPY